MKQLLLAIAFILASTVTLVAQEDVKGVAILKPVDEVGDVSAGVKLNLRATLAYAINHMSGYEAYTRVNLSAIMDEHKFQRTGFVDNLQIKKIGKATGAKYILIAEVAYYDKQHITVAASIIDIETTKIKEASDPVISPVDPDGMRESCIKIARSLLDLDGVSINGTPPTDGGVLNTQRGQDFIETAFGINMKMVYVEGGTFTMGCIDEKVEFSDSERPTRQTTVSSFYIGMLEVTQGQWEKIMKTDVDYQEKKYEESEHEEASFFITGSEYPMYYVSWEEAKEFCMRLNRITGRNYCLPTEAEWEFAARGGTWNVDVLFSGSQVIDDVAWYAENSEGSPQLCGMKSPNKLGIYDMSGNVMEWCEDFFVYKYLPYDNNNPKGGLSGTRHVLRGGCWFYGYNLCRATCRFCDHYSRRRPYIGFRVVCH